MTAILLCPPCPECKVGDAKPDLSRLEELAAGLRLHEHLCLIYETQEEQFASAVPYLRAGLARRERCLYIADENSRTAVLEALRKTGIDIDRHIRSGSLTLIRKQEAYPRGKSFDPDWWIGFMSQAIREAGNGNFSGSRTLLGEMTWTVGEETAPESLIEYEAKLNDLVRDHDVRVLCQYQRRSFSPELILGIIRTHPVVVYRGIICGNPYYVPPEEFLKPNQASREVERLLNNILTWQRSFEQLRAVTRRLESVREEERIRIAREIHDELGQALTTIKLELSSLLFEWPEGKKPSRRADSIIRFVDQTIESVRKISTELRPGILDALGLVAAVEWAAEEFENRTGTRCRLDLPKRALDIEPEPATAVFRIFQETLTNIARHADATQVEIRLATEDGFLELEVHDNGIGIGEEQLSKSASLGILGMRERALLLGGEFLIKGAPDQGTRVTARIPLSTPRNGAQAT